MIIAPDSTKCKKSDFTILGDWSSAQAMITAVLNGTFMFLNWTTHYFYEQPQCDKLFFFNFSPSAIWSQIGWAVNYYKVSLINDQSPHKRAHTLQKKTLFSVCFPTTRKTIHLPFLTDYHAWWFIPVKHICQPLWIGGGFCLWTYHFSGKFKNTFRSNYRCRSLAWWMILGLILLWMPSGTQFAISRLHFLCLTIFSLHIWNHIFGLPNLVWPFGAHIFRLTFWDSHYGFDSPMDAEEIPCGALFAIFRLHIFGLAYLGSQI